MNTIESQFRDAIAAFGITPPDEVIADGTLRRFATNGKRSDDSGWYTLHADGIPAGAFGCWRSGLSQTWQMDIGRQLSAIEGIANAERMVAMRKQRDDDSKARRAGARTRAVELWKAATPAGADHPYLARKGIMAYGIRVHGGTLVVPMRDADGKLHSLQFIDAKGDKLFLAGGKVAGCYYAIGTPAATVCIAEGFATAASIHEATGYAVAAAFNAGNLEAVARAVRRKLPGASIILCADDDYRTEGNPGITKATAAARAVGGLLAVPDFGADRPEGATDFNDLHQHAGAEAVKAAVERALAAARADHHPGDEGPTGADPAGDVESQGVTSEIDVTDVTGVQASIGAPSRVTSGKSDDVTDVTANPIPGPEGRPRFVVLGDWTEADGRKYRPGVWYFGLKHGRKADEPPALTEQWVCSPLHVEAVTFDGQENNFGRLLRFRNTIKRWREWAMPMELLRAAGDDLRGELLAMGLLIDPNAHKLLGQYLQAVTPTRHMHCAVQVGWCGTSFVLPDEVIGPNAADVIFQTGERGHDEHTRGGTLEGWRADLAARAVGNPLLMLAIAASFAGPLLAKCNAEGGGIHLVGDSSTGKTTAIEVACATWGGTNYRRSWRATANGIEGAAALFSDCLLALDEISECDPREIGAIVYALGNGRGKQRASRTGAARSVTRWRCMVLSSGERTLATAMVEGGRMPKAGQAVRLLDVPAARRFGAWDDLHGFADGPALSDALKRAAATHHGHAGRAFLHRLAHEGRDLAELLERIKALPAFAADGAEGQDKRAAARFALVALAGELATEYGLTGWPEGEAINAAAEGFRAWQAMRGRGNDERRQIPERIAEFIERHGDSRFSDADATSDDPIRINRAGWWRDSAGVRVYLFNAAGLREALTGFDFKRALDVLQDAGALPARSGERAKPERIGGRVVRLYAIHVEKLRGDDGP
ncbi:MAG: DUF927 domain-containing protein [Burkholderiales bacterium]|nr:DUF927 domain-containing protein [Burkholderiales bacterium]